LSVKEQKRLELGPDVVATHCFARRHRVESLAEPTRVSVGGDLTI